MKVKKVLCFIMCTFLFGSLVSGCSLNSYSNDSSGTSSNTSDSTSTTSEVSEVEKVELPFEPIDRPTLLADSMPSICEPKINDDLIQSWIINNF